MASFEINGVTPLVGKVRISGSKNEALKLIPLSIVLKSKVKITNVPEITDVFSQIQIAKQLGVKTSFENGVLTLESSDVSDFDIKSKFAKKLRASIVFLGPLLARFKKVKCRYPGGCVIGSRSIETHTDAFKQLGAKVNQNQRNIEISLDVPKKCAVNLKEKSVSATENIFLYASAIESEITISNCAVEPEVIHLSKILEKAGAKFDWINDRKVTISGTTNLKLDEIEVISDRIEAGTFLIGLIATGGEGEISNFPAEYLDALISILKGCGAKFKVTGDVVRVFKNGVLEPFKIKTEPYPGFPTDLQSPMALIASKANGISEIHELMFENRLGYLKELERMGLKVKIQGKNSAKIFGPAKFIPTKIDSLDLRAGITLLIAATMTEGKTIIREAENIDRGYENIEDKLKSLGAKIKRTDD